MDSVHGIGRQVNEKDLAAQFTALTKGGGEELEPFRWQMRLLGRFLSDDLPAAVDIPTGLGKTSVMALWLIGLAAGVRLPRRLVYVVDRRAVVDQASRFAERLQTNLRDLPTLAHALGLGDGGELPVSTLRGQLADNRVWLEDPAKPAIVVGTIDMVGSRLLFEGYGVSRRMRPYHAGFLGADVLLLLDEAHLCPPFEYLLRQIVAHRDGMLGQRDPSVFRPPPFHLMSLSATGRHVTGGATFRLADEDRSEPEVRRRLVAAKRLKVTEVEAADALPPLMAERAMELAGAGSSQFPARVLAYCNSRKDALQVKELIDKACKQRQRIGDPLVDDARSELLVGERRVHERTRLEGWLQANGFLGGSKQRRRGPTFLVATSAGEVGVDLDADHMVCDLVAYERMVQRLGRVNRRGGQTRTAQVHVVAFRPLLKSSASKAERERHAAALCLLDARLVPLRMLDLGTDERRDASPDAILRLRQKRPDVVEAASSKAPLHPQLTRPLLDAWSMTSLERHEGRPEVAPWLRGWVDDEPQCSVIWRTHLPTEHHEGEARPMSVSAASAFFEAVPVHAIERLEAPSDRVFEWLGRRAARVVARGDRGQGTDSALEADDPSAFLLDRQGDVVGSATLAQLAELGPVPKGASRAERRERDRRKRQWKVWLRDAALVVDVRFGGLTAEGMLDERTGEHVETLDADWGDQVGYRVLLAGGAGAEEDGLQISVPEGWRHVRTFESGFDGSGIATRGMAILKKLGTDTDEESRSVSVLQTLRDHAADVASRVRGMSERLGLPEDEVRALEVAARMHDDGKAAARWQRAMKAPAKGGPYAKTAGGGNYRLLEGYRHEFGSLLKAEREELPEAFRDLILHLISAHHGNARPVIGSDGCEEGPPSQLEARAGEAALRFVRLQRRYGPWGLAWREAILRAADQSASKALAGREADRSHG